MINDIFYDDSLWIYDYPDMRIGVRYVVNGLYIYIPNTYIWYDAVAN